MGSKSPSREGRLVVENDYEIDIVKEVMDDSVIEIRRELYQKMKEVRERYPKEFLGTDKYACEAEMELWIAYLEVVKMERAFERKLSRFRKQAEEPRDPS